MPGGARAGDSAARRCARSSAQSRGRSRRRPSPKLRSRCASCSPSSSWPDKLCRTTERTARLERSGRWRTPWVGHFPRSGGARLPRSRTGPHPPARHADLRLARRRSIGCLIQGLSCATRRPAAGSRKRYRARHRPRAVRSGRDRRGASRTIRERPERVVLAESAGSDATAPRHHAPAACSSEHAAACSRGGSAASYAPPDPGPPGLGRAPHRGDKRTAATPPRSLDAAGRAPRELRGVAREKERCRASRARPSSSRASPRSSCALLLPAP